MSVETKETPIQIEGGTLVLSPRLAENFKKADRQLLESYGTSPGVPALVRLWLACGTPTSIRGEFELAVMDIKKPELSGKGFFDDEEFL